MKSCTVCKILKSVSEFYPNSKGKNGLQSWCKQCASEKNRDHRIRNPDKEQARQKKIHQNRKTDPVLRDKRLKDHLRLKFKMTLEEYNDKLKEQSGTCAICKKTCFKRLSVDHDHSCCPYAKNHKCCGSCTRGLLCSKCNHALGLFMDSIDILKQAIQYLDKYKP